jgi:toxin CptA
MAVHYFVFERRHQNFGYLFLSPRDTKLKAFNPAAFIAFFAGIVMTWMCMYGSYPILQGPVARAAGGIDFSWLAGTVTAAGLYFVLGYPRFRSRIAAGVPLGIQAGIPDEQFLAEHGDAEAAPADEDGRAAALAGPEPETAASSS